MPSLALENVFFPSLNAQIWEVEQVSYKLGPGKPVISLGEIIPLIRSILPQLPIYKAI